MSTTPATAPAPLVSYRQVLRRRLQDYAPVIRRLLAPTGVEESTFLAWIANATRADPEKWAKVEPETLLGAALRCAQVGLAPNDGTSAAWIIPYGREATFQLGYRGVLELARRAVPGIRFEGHAVYPGDKFGVNYASGEYEHVPYMARSPRRPRGGDPDRWYVVAIWPDGTRQIEVIDREEAERHRGYSRAPGGDLWAKSYDAAALKSAVWNLRRWLPDSPAMARATAIDGVVADVRDMADEAEETELDGLPEGGADDG
jgi:recombination protein RecT